MDLEKFRKKIHKKKQIKGIRHQKKINYPWLKRSYSRKAKAYIAFLVDNHPHSASVAASERKKKEFFIKHIYPGVIERFPNLYQKVKRYYKNHGKNLDKKHFSTLLYARMVNMYEKGFTVKTSEHPINSSNSELSNDYCNLL